MSLVVALVLALATAVPLVAQQPARAPSARPVYRATRVDKPPIIDGLLDDEAWKKAEVIDLFIQQLPDEGRPATERTEARIVFDRDNLYISAHCYDREPQKLIANELKRDQGSISTKDDSFAVILDPFHDYRNSILLIVTPRGSVHDILATDERQFNWDWDTVWDARTRMDDEGWQVEMVIPFKSLRYDPSFPGPWGFNLRRSIIRKGEHAFLTQIPRELGVPGAAKLSVAAHLVGLGDVAASHHVELKPFATTGAAQDFVNGTGASKGRGKGGLDVKYGVTQSLNLDATYNTDFAQVEADTQQVNLTRFSLFFPEKRDFFLEGRDVYNFGVGREGSGNPNTTLLFFSRRIGIEGASEVPIVGGARLTGKAGAYSVGLLNIETGRSASSPLTNFSVVRVKRDFLQRSNLGVIVTNKSPSGRDSNQAVGVDANFFFHRSSSAAAFLARTWTPGKSGHDYAGRAQIVYNLDGYGAEFDYLTVGRNFNPEVGFVRRRDMRSSSGSLRYSPRLNKRLARQIFFRGEFDYLTDTRNVLQTRTQAASFEIESARADRLRLAATRNFERLEAPFAIQPKVIIPTGAYGFDEFNVRFTLGPSRKYSGSIDYTGGDFYGGTKHTLTLNSVSKPSSHVMTTFNYQRNDVALPQGAFVTHLIGSQLDYAATTRLFTAVYLQWNSSAELAVVNFRLNYIYKLGSDFFIVYSENRQTGTLRPGPRDRTFVVKFTYLLRL